LNGTKKTVTSGRQLINKRILNKVKPGLISKPTSSHAASNVIRSQTSGASSSGVREDFSEVVDNRQSLRIPQRRNRTVLADANVRVTRPTVLPRSQSTLITSSSDSGLSAASTVCEDLQEMIEERQSLRTSQRYSRSYGGSTDLNERLAEIQLQSQRRESIEDIDAGDRNDPLACTEYVNEIYSNMKREEMRLLPDSDYMSVQPDISDKMRSILVDWLVDVHQKFKLSPDTLYLTINVVDRFLSKEVIVRQKLQLVGVTSMLIASKYHEIYAPETNDFVYISDRAYSREEILKMEACVLNTLNFNVTVPSPFVFLLRWLKAAKADMKMSSYANFCLELAQQDYSLVGTKPSVMSAAACLVAGKQCSGLVWNEIMQHYTGLRETELSWAAERLCTLVENCTPDAKLTAVRRKYANVKHYEVSKMPLVSMVFA